MQYEPDTIHRLVDSQNKGRLALDTPHGTDITAGQLLKVYFDGKWLRGRVEYFTDYCLVDTDGGHIGLTAGMVVAIEGRMS